MGMDVPRRYAGPGLSLMKVSHSSRSWLSPRAAEDRVHESRRPRSQVESAIKGAPGRSEVASAMIGPLGAVIPPTHSTMKPAGIPRSATRDRENTVEAIHPFQDRIERVARARPGFNGPNEHLLAKPSARLHAIGRTGYLTLGHAAYHFVLHRRRRVAGRVPVTHPLRGMRGTDKAIRADVGKQGPTSMSSRERHALKHRAADRRLKHEPNRIVRNAPNNHRHHSASRSFGDAQQRIAVLLRDQP